MFKIEILIWVVVWFAAFQWGSVGYYLYNERVRRG